MLCNYVLSWIQQLRETAGSCAVGEALLCAAAERLVSALNQQLYCVPETSARSLKDAAAASDKALEATVNVYKQQQVCAVTVGVGQHYRALVDMILACMMRHNVQGAAAMVQQQEPCTCTSSNRVQTLLTPTLGTNSTSTPPPPKASDVSLVKEPRSLQDFWLFKLHREAPSKAYVLIK